MSHTDTLTSTIVDLTHPLNPNTQSYPGDEHFSFHPIATSSKNGYNTRSITLGSHTGTHIDAPFHFFPDGKTVDQIPLDDLIGEALVVDLSNKPLKSRQKITWEDLKVHFENQCQTIVSRTDPKHKMVLVNTGWSKKFWKTPEYYNHPYFSRDIAENILKLGICVFGSDTLNPDETPFNDMGGEEGFGFHEVMLGAGGVIAENLTNLDSICVGEPSSKARNIHWVVSLIPLNLDGSDGSPVRAFACNFKPKDQDDI